MALDEKSISTLSASALRRLAHAVRPKPGSQAWVVMQADSPPFHRVAAVAATRQAAEESFRSRGVAETQYFMVGPVDDAEEDCSEDEEFDPALHTCWSDPEEPTLFDVFTTVGGSKQPLTRKPKRREVFGVDLKVRQRHGPNIHYEWDKSTESQFPYDAICFTRCATRKFFYPYYQLLYGSDYVERLTRLLNHK